MLKAVPTEIMRYDEDRARLAFEAYASLVGRELVEPDLVANPEWRTIKDFAFRHFQRLYEAPL